MSFTKKFLVFAFVAVFTLGIVFNSAFSERAYSSSKPQKKIVFWHITTDATGKQMIQNQVNRFMKDNPNVKVEVVPLQNDAFKTKLKIAMGANQAPDVFVTWGGGPFYEYIKSGKVRDITTYMNENNYKSRFLDASFGPITYNNKIYGVPVEGAGIAVVWYNKELFKKYSLKIPTTFDELLSLINTLKSKGIAPFALANKTKWPGCEYYWYLVDRIAGPSAFEKAASRNNGTFEDPAFIKAGELLQQLVKAGAFAKGFNGLDYDTGQSRMLLYSGKAAMELMGTWQIPIVKSENKQFYEKNLDFFPFPTVKGGKGDPNNLIGMASSNYYAVSSNSKAPKEAFTMIKYLINDEAIKERIAYGQIPPVKGMKFSDPMLQKVYNAISKAKSVQLWWDQYLPPQLAEVQKDVTQALFGLTITPKDAAAKMEKAAKETLGK